MALSVEPIQRRWASIRCIFWPPRMRDKLCSLKISIATHMAMLLCTSRFTSLEGPLVSASLMKSSTMSAATVDLPILPQRIACSSVLVGTICIGSNLNRMEMHGCS
eukprot:2690711-Amphidinium_carterae.1